MKGFTLIEVVVSIAVAMLATGLIISNYNNYNDTQTLKQAGLTLKNNLRFAQTKALSGEKPTTVCTQLNGYRVTFTASYYDIQASCNPEGLTGAIISTNLPTKVSFAPLPNPSSFTFNVLSRGSSLAAPLTITIAGFDTFYRLLIRTGGDISEQ